MIELYGDATGNSLRVAIALEEAGVPYRAVRVDLRKGAHRSAEYLKPNPAYSARLPWQSLSYAPRWLDAIGIRPGVVTGLQAFFKLGEGFQT